MHIRKSFGIPRWVLDTQTVVQQALEVYSGKVVRFGAFEAKSGRNETHLVEEKEILDVEWIFYYSQRWVEFAGKVEGLSGLPHTVEGKFRLRQEDRGEAWWVNIDSWEFILRDHRDMAGNFAVENIETRNWWPGQPHRIKVFKQPYYSHQTRTVEGTNVLDRTVIEDRTHLLSVYTNH